VVRKDAAGLALEQALRDSGLWVIAYNDPEGSIWELIVRNL